MLRPRFAGRITSYNVCYTKLLRQGAEVLVTGDVKYHEARTALSLGLALLDAGHFGTEQLMVRELAIRLRSAAEARKMNLNFIETEGESDPFQTI